MRCGPNEIENETDMKVADSLTTWRSQRARRAICRKSAQTFHLPLVKYEDEYSLCDCKSLSLYFGRKTQKLDFWKKIPEFGKYELPVIERHR